MGRPEIEMLAAQFAETPERRRRYPALRTMGTGFSQCDEVHVLPPAAVYRCALAGDLFAHMLDGAAP
jgi:hypothetical protein